MTNLREQAEEFRQTYNQDMFDGLTQCGFLKLRTLAMQTGLIEEESREFLDAVDALILDPHKTSARVNLLKELADLVFVCYQFAATYNLDLDEAMHRIYESNLSKLDEAGNPIFRDDGKVLKGPTYKPPFLEDLVVQKQGPMERPVDTK